MNLVRDRRGLGASRLRSGLPQVSALLAHRAAIELLAGLAVVASIRPFSGLQSALGLVDLVAAATTLPLLLIYAGEIPRFLKWIAASSSVIFVSGLLHGVDIVSSVRPLAFAAILGLAILSGDAKRFARAAYYGVAAVVTLQLLGSLFGLGRRLDSLSSGGPVDGRLVGWPFAVHPNEIAMMSGAVLTIATTRLLDRGGSRIDVASAAVAAVALITSESRTAAVAAAASLLTAWVISSMKHSRWRSLSAGFVLLAILVFPLTGAVRDFTGERFESGDGSQLSGRTRAWSVVVDDALDDVSIGLIGVGPKGVTVPVEGISRPTQGVDNGYLVLLRMGGVVASALFAVGLGSALRRVTRHGFWGSHAMETTALGAFILIGSLAQSELVLLSPATLLFWSYVSACSAEHAR